MLVNEIYRVNDLLTRQMSITSATPPSIPFRSGFQSVAFLATLSASTPPSAAACPHSRALVAITLSFCSERRKLGRTGIRLGIRLEDPESFPEVHSCCRVTSGADGIGMFDVDDYVDGELDPALFTQFQH